MTEAPVPETVGPQAPRPRRLRAAVHPIRADGQALGTALVAVLILISGNPALSGPLAPPLLALLVAGTLLLPRPRLTRRASFGTRYVVMAAVLLLVFVSQWARLGFVSWPACLYFLAKLLIGGFVVHRIGPHFPTCMLRATYLFCLLSLPAYALLLVVGNGPMPTLFPESWIGENLKSLLVLTIHMTPEWWRNSGPMWEPGAFQGIINLALLLAPVHLLTSPAHRGKVAVLVIALLTTFSTTGYVVLFLIALYKILAGRSSGALKVPLLLTVLTVAAFTYVEADFLGQKIAEQVANTATQEDFTPDRFGALLFDLHYIEKSPWIGNGFHESTRFADHPWLHGEPLGHGNGLSNFTACLGFIGLAVYFGGLATCGLVRSSLDRSALAVLVAVLAFGEQFLLFPLFLGLPFLTAAAPAPPRRRRRPAVPVTVYQDSALWTKPTPTTA